MTKVAKEFFADTRLEIVMKSGARCSRVFLVDTAAKEWDGAGPSTNAAIYSDRCAAMHYVELVLTGKVYRVHPGHVHGLKAKVRFTGPDDTGEWLEAVVRPVPPSASNVV